jgi:hypothetical protein
MSHGTILSRFINAVADILASNPMIADQHRAAFRQQATLAIEDEFSKAFGGEQLRAYVPKLASERRRERAERIAASLAAGHSPEEIAQRESVTPRHVRRIRGSIGGRFGG